MKPLIGITPDVHGGRRLKTRTPDEKIIYLWDRYHAALLAAGALPVILPVTAARAEVCAIVERLDGLLLPGGNFDIPPELFGQERQPYLGPVKLERSLSEHEMILEALRRGVPVLGICGGMQAVNVALGGTLYQDLGEERPRSRAHSQKTRADKTCHQVTIATGTRLHRIVTGGRGGGSRRLRVNSTHHQAVRDVGPFCRISAVAADGVVEGIEVPGKGFVVGVQWHPELLYPRYEEQARIFRSFVRAAKRSSA